VIRLRRRRGDDDLYGGDVAPLYPQTAPARAADDRSPAAPGPDYDAESPGRLSRWGHAVDDWRRRALPLPDEIIDQYLGHGERMIHNDHPSLGAFIVQNTLLLGALFFVAVVVLGVTFNGSAVTAGVAFLIFGLVLLWLVLKRLRERYTSYVVTNVRIMRISGVFARRAHSIPWVRVTDLTYEQTLVGRMLGYATLHIESANEEGGLRDLEGVSDPIRFNQYIVDMVVAKQGPTAPGWEQQGEPAPIISLPRSGVFERFRAGRHRRRSAREAAAAAERASEPDLGPPVSRRTRAATAPVRQEVPRSVAPTRIPPERARTDPALNPPPGLAPYDVDLDEPSPDDEPPPQDRGDTGEGLPWAP
jgi:membrane protein YdbS with pleckstrin-like domain